MSETSNMARPRSSRAPRGAIAIVVLAVLAVGAVFLFTRPAAAHPDPRPNIGGDHVMDHAAFSGYPRVQETYRMAAEIPQVLDGLYCHCDCSKHSGHYSLLDCFASEHGAGCDICLTEAQLAYRMTKEGRSLDEIRSAIDDLYGQGH
jgi:hypothetical protein